MDKTTAERLERLLEARAALKEAVGAIGEEQGPPNGLEALAEKVKTATVLDDDATAVVTATGSVAKGDAVALTRELSARSEELTLAGEGAVLLDASVMWYNKTEGATQQVVVFTQNGKTWLKPTLWTGTEWEFGPTLELLDAVVEKAVVVSWQSSSWGQVNGTHYFAVLYRDGEFGMLKAYSVKDNKVSQWGADLWSDESPYNITAAYVPSRQGSLGHGAPVTLNTSFTSEIVVSYLAGETGELHLSRLYMEWNYDETREPSYYYTVEILQDKVVPAGAHEGVEWFVMRHSTGKDTFEDEFSVSEPFTVADWDREEYLSPGAWCMGSDPKTGEGWLVYPGADGKRYLMCFLTDELRRYVKKDTYWGYETYRTLELEPIGCVPLVLQGGTAASALAAGVNFGSVGNVSVRGPYVVSSRAKELNGGRYAHSVSIEGWACGYALNSANLWFADIQQSGNVGLLSATLCGAENDGFAVGWSMGDCYMAMLCYKRERDILGGPTVKLGKVGTAGKLIKSGAGVALVTQRKDGIFLRQFNRRDVVERVTDSSIADAIAVTAGRSGQSIRVRTVKQ